MPLLKPLESDIGPSLQGSHFFTYNTFVSNIGISNYICDGVFKMWFPALHVIK